MGAAKGAPQLSLDYHVNSYRSWPHCGGNRTLSRKGNVNQMTPVPAYVVSSLLIGQSLVTWLCFTLLGEGHPLMALTAGPDSLVLEEDRV